MPPSKPDLNLLADSLPTMRPRPPIERWNPPLSGDIAVRIARDGTWYHEGVAFQREALVRLFASILRHEDDGHYYLVTPVEKWRITVEDAPFLAAQLDVSGVGAEQALTFTTTVGDCVTAGPDHPLVVEYRTADGQPSPYIHIRGGLRALLSRAVFVELVGYGEERPSTQGRDYGVWSGGQFFHLGWLDSDR